MRLSLRVRVLLLVAAVNVVIFGAGLAYLTYELAAERRELEDDWMERIGDTLQRTVTARGDIRVAQILAWPYWEQFDDAIIFGLRPAQLAGDGDARPRGVFLNPVGSWQRQATFERAAIERDIVRCVETARPHAGRRGLSVPIFDPRGQVWGGCWFYLRSEVDAQKLFRRLLPWFLSSTLLLTLGTFFALRRFVLDPVRLLGQGASRVAAGDFSARLEVPGRSDELTELIRGFNLMTATVQGFNERLAREVEIATEKARSAEAAAMTQRRLAATGELAAGIAHEINNPLGGLLNALEALSSGRLEEHKRVQYQALLKSGLERIQRTVGQLLRFTPRQAESAPVALWEAVFDALALVAHRARQQGVAIRLHAADGAADLADDDSDEATVQALWKDLPPVRGARHDLGQALLNLLVNALDALEEKVGSQAGSEARATGSGGRIDLTLERVRGDDGHEELRVEVRDDGPGVETAQLGQLADLFYTTKDVGRGTGLGLAIVHTVAAGCGGRVRLSGEPGVGLCVELSLPVWEPPPPQAEGA